MKKIVCFLLVMVLLVLGLFSLKSKEMITYGAFNEPKSWYQNLSLEEKIAQLLFIRVDGTSLSEEKNALNTYSPGGIVLFSDNINNYEELKKFISDLKDACNIIPFISVDYEGGTIDRFGKLNEVKRYPSARTLGLSDEAYTYVVATEMANILKDLGFNMDFAPVLDITDDYDNFLYERTFSGDPSIVSKFASTFAKGLNDNDIVPVYKHYPGHGSTSSDSHTTLPVSFKNKTESYRYCNFLFYLIPISSKEYDSKQRSFSLL